MSTQTKQRLPEWLRNTTRKSKATEDLSAKLHREVPNSICQEAKCPNRGECFGKGILTFMVLGTVCTRNCTFCSVRHGKPMPADRSELKDIINAIEKLSLKFVVLTSPNRDDLEDGGAAHYAFLISGIRAHAPHVKIEVLIPDFQGKTKDLDIVIAANPDVINHNLETVPSLYTTVRKGSLYKRSLDVLDYIKTQAPHILSKTGIMVGLGETNTEIYELFEEVKSRNVDILTIGQYLPPSRDNAELKRYVPPAEFDEYKERGEKLGVPYVFSGPLVRSSYLADHVFDDVIKKGE